MDRKLISARIDASIWRLAKADAATSGKELWKWLEDVIRLALSAKNGNGKEKRR